MKRRYAKGTDTVDAKLTPREAVLNRNAAELLGRDAIARLNAHGNMLAKRGVDLASLPSDPTPGPSTENMLGYQRGTSSVYSPEHEDQGDAMMIDLSKLPLSPDAMNMLYLNRQARSEDARAKAMNEKPNGYQMGTANVRRDDRADLLRDAENTFYGGGGAPVPSPTPTPKPRRGYQYGTSSVDDLNPYSTALSSAGSAMFPTPSAAPAASMVSRYRLPPTNWKSHTDMATGIAKQRKALFTGSQLASTQQNAPPPGTVSRMPFVSGGYQFPAGSPLPQGFQEDNAGGLTKRVSPATAARFSKSPFVEGGYVFPTGTQLPEGFQESGGGGLTRQVPQEDNTTTHFLPSGFTAAVGSSGAQGSTPNDIHFLPPGFSSVQGVTNPQSKQLQFVPPKDDQYGSAYG